jgi:hypothetical protein
VHCFNLVKKETITKSVIIATILMVLGFAIFSLNDSSGAVNTSSSKAEKLGLRGWVLIQVYRDVDGSRSLIYEHESPNVITNYGLFLIQRWVSGTTSGAFQWTTANGGNNLYYTTNSFGRIALSADSTPVSATHSSWQPVDSSYPANIEIIDGGLQRSTTVTVTYNAAYTPGNGTTKGSITFAMAQTFTCQSGFSFTNVDKTGLFAGAYNTNSGVTSSVPISGLVAENTFPTVSLQPGDQIAITWRISL